MSRLLLACALLLVTTAGYAQTSTSTPVTGTAAATTAKPSKPKSPGEIAAHDRAMAEKRADCQKQAKEQKLGLVARRKFVNACVKG